MSWPAPFDTNTWENSNTCLTYFTRVGFNWCENMLSVEFVVVGWTVRISDLWNHCGHMK